MALPQTKKYHAIVIDDDKFMREYLTVLLENMNITVIPLSGSIHAFTTISDKKPDLIVLDYMMPGLSGFEFLRSLKLSPGISNIPVLMLTGSTKEEDRSTALQMGVTAYMTKPIDDADLTLKINEILNRTVQ